MGHQSRLQHNARRNHAFERILPHTRRERSYFTYIVRVNGLQHAKQHIRAIELIVNALSSFAFERSIDDAKRYVNDYATYNTSCTIDARAMMKYYKNAFDFDAMYTFARECVVRDARDANKSRMKLYFSKHTSNTFVIDDKMRDDEFEMMMTLDDLTAFNASIRDAFKRENIVNATSFACVSFHIYDENKYANARDMYDFANIHAENDICSIVFVVDNESHVVRDDKDAMIRERYALLNDLHRRVYGTFSNIERDMTRAEFERVMTRPRLVRMIETLKHDLATLGNDDNYYTMHVVLMLKGASDKQCAMIRRIAPYFDDVKLHALNTRQASELIDALLNEQRAIDIDDEHRSFFDDDIKCVEYYKTMCM